VLFSSAIFVFFFLPLVLLVYAPLRGRARNAWLLAASLLFYAWGEQTQILLMLAVIAVNWALGLWAAERARPQRARAMLAAAVAFDLALLGVFKYADFAIANLNAVRAQHGADALAPWAIPLPIGISFFTFQALSYVIDVYRGDAPVQRSLSRFALYVSLFPQLIAGPIVRYRDVAAQIAERRLTREDFARGLRRFSTGLAKKLVVANTAAGAADAIFAIDPGELTAAVAWLGVVCYAIQIYFDFSGYSDMAIGLGRMLGFRFLENFDYPYISRSLTEFWRRWHISLSTWFRDYLYIPLGGNRHGAARTYRNLVIVFALCGLWHGASWNFALWGLYHGAFLVAERWRLGAVLARCPAWLAHSYALVAVLFGWVLFRAPSLAHAAEFAASMLGLSRADPSLHPLALYLTRDRALVLLLGALGSAPWLPWLRARADALELSLRPGAHAGFAAVRAVAGAVVALALLLGSAACLASGTHNPFIYFRF
jgi:alginate O-acetyltransferase complex protein AlgI